MIGVLTLSLKPWGQAPRDGAAKSDALPVPGNMAIWVAIFSEMSEFAMMFIAYFVAKVHYPEAFQEGPSRLNTLAGMSNTLILLTSSYFVAKSVSSIRLNRVKEATRWLWLSVVAGCFYLVVKYYEYMWNTEQGIEVTTNIFFGIYYYMTFNHFLHVGWGSGALLWGVYRLKTDAYSADEHEGLESIGSYWHMIDLMWIIIFPLLYVLA